MGTDGGLREEKKRRTRQEILANAIALFRKHGIRETRTSEIAALSGVSPGTLFNYFPTKDALVEAWLRGELAGTVAEATSSLGERGLRPLLRSVCRSLASDRLEPPALRREGWAVLGRARSEHFRLDGSAPLVRVVGVEQERERVRNDLTALALAEMLMDGLEGGLIAAVAEVAERQSEHVRGQAEPGTDPRAIARGLEARVELILDGMRKRNERVSAPLKRRPATDTQA